MSLETHFLSHAHSALIPAYGGMRTIESKAIKDITCGDSCFVYSFTMENHWGTHIDAPAHFFRDAAKISDYPADFWKFQFPQIVDVSLGEGELLSWRQLEGKIHSETDLLLIYSGWSEKYREDEAKYCSRNPGVDPCVGEQLRANYPRLRVIGLDWISLSSYLKRDAGRQAHRSFLNPEGVGQPILIVEDMNLKKMENHRLQHVTLLPFRADFMDSAPCTVVGEWVPKS